MPEYLDDPSVLTKDKLKSELVAHNVELPLGNPTKDVYVHLYLKNLTAQNNRHMTATTLDAFSSDEDLPPPVVSSRSRSSGRKATRKTDKVRPDELDVTVLSDQGLKAELLKHGVEAGPIVATTRSLYEKKLQKLLDEGPAQTQLLVPEIQINHNGNHYSDQEDEVPAAPEPEAVSEPEAVPIVERPLRSRGKTPVPPHTPNHTLTEGELELSKDSSHKPVAPLNPALLEVEKIAASDQTPKVKNDVLKEIFTNEMNSPTGISATCRRPIRGAAGRPLKASDLWKDEKFLFSPRSSINSSSSSVYTESHRVSSLPPVSPRPSLPPVAPHRSMPLWVKLLLLLVLAAFLFLVYQAMETNSISPFVEQGSAVASSTA